MTEHISGPLPEIVTRVRRIAVAAIARDEGCSLDEASARLDAAKPVPEPTREQLATERGEAEARRIEHALRELALPVRGDLLPAIARANVRATHATKVTSEWLRSERRALVLVGDMGTGKTVAATLALAAWLRRRRTIGYLQEPRLVRWWHSSTLAHEQHVERLVGVDMLVIDELGTSTTRDAERSRDAVWGMLNERIAGERRTLLIGNLRPDDIGKRYGARFSDRLNEIGSVVHVVGASMRGEMRP
jgi:DNA replication protein DnaC